LCLCHHGIFEGSPRPNFSNAGWKPCSSYTCFTCAVRQWMCLEVRCIDRDGPVTRCLFGARPIMILANTPMSLPLTGNTCAACVRGGASNDHIGSSAANTRQVHHTGVDGAAFQLPLSIFYVDLWARKPCSRSVKREKPRHITVVPGGGSLFRSRYPPSRATMVM
jgi:hypothetical protein